jgi:putative membrane protein
MTQTGTTPRRRRPLVRFLLDRWVPILLTLLAVVFISQNRDRVSIDLFWLQVLAPLWLVLLVAVLAGVLIGSLGRRRRGGPSA